MSERILIADDDRSILETLEHHLTRSGYEVTTATSAEEALDVLPSFEPALVITDVRMPGTTGLQLCGQVAANRPDIPVVVMTAFGSMETAVAAMRAGAYDFVTKPIEMDVLAMTLRRAVNHRQLTQRVKRLREEIDKSRHFGEIIGEMQVIDPAPRAASVRAARDTRLLRLPQSDFDEVMTTRPEIARAIN